MKEASGVAFNIGCALVFIVGIICWTILKLNGVI